jgi:hypothetical protein
VAITLMIEQYFSILVKATFWAFGSEATFFWYLLKAFFFELDQFL